MVLLMKTFVSYDPVLLMHVSIIVGDVSMTVGLQNSTVKLFLIRVDAHTLQKTATIRYVL